jgi:surface antigen
MAPWKGKSRMRKAIVTAGALLLAACGTDARAPSPGANSGIVEGSQVGAGTGEASVGAIEGGLLGADIGLSLSEDERQAARQAEYEALEYGRAGQPTTWSTRSGTRGEISVGATYEVNRLDCREYSHTVYIDGRPRVARGTACRQPEGTWRIIG